MQSTGFAGRTITTEDDPLSARPQMAESSALADDDKLADRVHAPESGATPNLTDQLLDLLPAAVYVCAPDGTILRFNRRAAELWGRAPLLGDPRDRFCGAYRLYRPNGDLLPHDKCPMADILRDGIPVVDQEVVIERPNGSRGVALVNIRPLKDASGNVTGAVNCFYDITELMHIDQEYALTRGQVEELTVKLAQEREQQVALHRFTDRLYRADTRQASTTQPSMRSPERWAASAQRSCCSMSQAS